MAFYHKIHCKFTGVKGFVSAYEDGLKYRMLTNKAKHRAKVLIFWEKHGLEAAMDAFPVKRSTLFLWKKKFKASQGKLISLNDKKRIPKTTRKREWPFEIRQKIKQIRHDPLHPNLGPDKIHPLLEKFCKERGLKCPKVRTITRVIADDPEKMRIFPQKISHFGKIKKANRQKVLRKPKSIKPEYPGHSFNFLYVLTDNGSEFKKHFSERLKELHLTHYHTYPKTPRMNAHVERFNRTIQDDWIDWHLYELKDPDIFNRSLVDYLIFYNTERVHHAFQNKLSPIQFMIQWQKEQLLAYQTAPHTIKFPYESKIGWRYTIK